MHLEPFSSLKSRAEQERQLPFVLQVRQSKGQARQERGAKTIVDLSLHCEQSEVEEHRMQFAKQAPGTVVLVS